MLHCKPNHPLIHPLAKGRDMARTKSTEDGVIIIKKYANRRLYNTYTSSYVTLEHLAVLVKEDRDFKVVDAKSGDDITRSVLAQIIFDKESKESGDDNMLPVSFLKQLISLYGEGMQKFVPNYLQTSLETLMANSQKIQEQFHQPEPLKMFEEMTKKNMAMMQQGMQLFTSKMAEAQKAEAAKDKTTEKATDKTAQKPEQKPGESEKAAPAKSKATEEDDKIDALQAQLASLQDQISKLGK